MRFRRPFLMLVLLLVVMAPLPARAQNGQPPVTPGDPRAVYIVVLNREKGAEPEFDKGGAKQLARWSNRVVVELPPQALAAMLKHGRVKYVQHLVIGPVTASSAPSSERSASASFVPKALTGGGTLQWSTGDYHYDGSGNIDRVGADSSGYTRRFVYDEVDRLVEAGVEAPLAAPGTYTNYSRYTYDSFGNRLSEQTPTINATVVADKNTNRITLPGTIVTYDGVGNMTQGGGLMYQYDPFNNLKEVDSWSAVQKMSIYNADNERIIFCGDGSSGPCRWTLRGIGNGVLREYESGPIGNGNSYWSYYLWVEDSVYRGTLLAGAQRETAEGGRLHFHLDHLGSPRLTTNAAGQKVTANEFAPFGRELTSIMQEAQLGYDRTETHRFTGHERDFVEGTGSETVNFIDYMHARSYTPVFGRFLTADPELSVEKSMAQPQRWNRYAYAMNNPIRFNDPNGRDEREGWQAGVVVNQSNQVIYVAGDHKVGEHNETVVIPLGPGENSSAYLTDADAVVVAPGQSIDGATSGGFKIGASTVEISGNGPGQIELNRGAGYVANAAIGHAGQFNAANGKKNSWVAPTTQQAKAAAAKKAQELKREKQQAAQQQKAEEERRRQKERQEHHWWQFWR